MKEYRYRSKPTIKAVQFFPDRPTDLPVVEELYNTGKANEWRGYYIHGPHGKRHWVTPGQYVEVHPDNTIRVWTRAAFEAEFESVTAEGA